MRALVGTRMKEKMSLVAMRAGPGSLGKTTRPRSMAQRRAFLRGADEFVADGDEGRVGDGAPAPATMLFEDHAESVRVGA